MFIIKVKVFTSLGVFDGSLDQFETKEQAEAARSDIQDQLGTGEMQGFTFFADGEENTDVTLSGGVINSSVFTLTIMQS
jgi:hypothetical protein